MNKLDTCFGWLRDDLSVLSVVHDEDVRDDDKQETPVIIESATVDDVGVGRLWFRLSKILKLRSATTISRLFTWIQTKIQIIKLSKCKTSIFEYQRSSISKLQQLDALVMPCDNQNLAQAVQVNDRGLLDFPENLAQIDLAKEQTLAIAVRQK